MFTSAGIEANRRRLPLRTREFDCFFDSETGFLRRLNVGGVEVVRAIYGAVRDENWGTLQPVLADVRLSGGADGFELHFDADCRAGEAHFRWKGSVRGEAGELEFVFAGRALSAFRRNRIGLCVLHPLVECAGKSCRILTTDGAWNESGFPGLVAPHQPFKNVRAMAWEPAEGISAEVSFEGEIFETEDQRNWTDASFEETYSTPLELPFPVEVAAGTEVRQRVVLKILRRAAVTVVANARVPEIRFADMKPVAKPPMGLGMTNRGAVLNARETGLLRRLALSHLRVDLHLADPRWSGEWARAQTDAAAIGAALHCALFLSENAAGELSMFAKSARNARVPVALCLVFHAAEKSTSPRRLALAAEKLAPLGIQVAGGTNACFAELNRHRPPAGTLGGFSLNPQVHAFDDLSLVENLEAQPYTIMSALAFGARGAVVSPITLRPRFNPDATADTEARPGKLPASVDVRQRTLFGAAWTVGSLARLAALRGVHSLTFYESTGWRGVMETAAGPLLPDEFPSSPGEVFPMFHVFADLADCDRLLAMQVGEVLKVAALGLLPRTGGRRILVANLQPDVQTIRIVCDAPHAMVRRLDEASATLASAEPESFRADAGVALAANNAGFELALSSCEIVRLDLP